MATIAISGAGSGIGHEFLNFLAATPENTIHAIDVTWSDGVASKDFKAKIKRHTTNTSDQASVDKLVSDLNGQAIDLFIHSAAVRGLVPAVTERTDDPGAAETLEVMDSDTMKGALEVNVLGSFLLIRALLPSLKAAKQGKCAVMGSRMGSLTSNDDGGSYAYRASKAGLNALVKSFSVDVPEVIFTIIHPGRVESRMTHTREDGAIDSDEAIKLLLPLIEKLGKGDTGKFYGREGEEIPW